MAVSEQGDLRSEGRFVRSRPECPEPWLWHSEDVGGVEDEVRGLIVRSIETVKPIACVETGAWRGSTARAIAEALERNGRGYLWSLELDPDAATAAVETIAGVAHRAEVVQRSSLEWRPTRKLDFVFLDSSAGIRGLEFLHFYPWMHARTLVLVHDTGRHRLQPRRELEILRRIGLLQVVWLPTPRGLAICQPAFPAGRAVRLRAARTALQDLLPAILFVEEKAIRARDRFRRG